MSEPYIGQIIHIGFNFASRGFAFCNGQLLPISSNQALFSILGTTYGGDGRTNFALPNLQGRTPLGSGHGPGLTNRALGSSGGEDTHALTTDEIPSHNHMLYCDSQPASATTPGGHIFAEEGAQTAIVYSDQVPNATLREGTIGNTGGGQPHNNVMPTLAVYFCIATQGLFPPRD